MRDGVRRRSARCRSAAGAAPSFDSSAAKRSRSSARSMESGEVPMIGTPACSSGTASLSGVWPPNCTMTPSRLLALDDAQHVLERQRLEVELVGGVVVGADRLRVAVDHDGLEAVFLQREGGVHAAVVELDALPDAVRAAAEDHDLLARRDAATRPRPRRSSRGTACRPRTRRRRCRPSCRPARCRRRGAPARICCLAAAA